VVGSTTAEADIGGRVVDDSFGVVAADARSVPPGTGGSVGWEPFTQACRRQISDELAMLDADEMVDVLDVALAGALVET